MKQVAETTQTVVSTETLPLTRNNGKLPKFNKSIVIHVSVDKIAEDLLGTFQEDLAHRELMTHAIMATAIENDTIHHLYNALNGFLPDINFNVGDMIVCTEQESWQEYDANKENEKGELLVQAMTNDEENTVRPVNMRKRQCEIGYCEVVEVNPFAAKKLTVKFMGYKRGYSSEKEMITMRVDHTNCKYLQP